MDDMLTLDQKLDDVARDLGARNFGVVAQALRARIDPIIRRWREQSFKSMPALDELTIEQFESSMAVILEAMAVVMESDDPVHIRRVIEQSPAHGVSRLTRNLTLDGLLAEERILRSAIIVELREQMGRPLADKEAAALHELIDLMLEHSVIALIRRRNQLREDTYQKQIEGVHRLTDLGTLVAGVAHDASNLLLPLRMSIDHLKRFDLPSDARMNVEIIEHVFQHFQNSIVNLRWLSVDASHRSAAGQSLNLRDFIRDFEPFQRLMMPRDIALKCEVAEGLPAMRISQAALSQILFNLVRNAQQAILADRGQGCITVHAKPGLGGTVQVIVEDDGPGMPPDVRARCMEPYFTTRALGAGTGLGLTLVQALLIGAGGAIEVLSPPPGKPRGTAVVIALAQPGHLVHAAVAEAVAGLGAGIGVPGR